MNTPKYRVYNTPPDERWFVDDAWDRPDGTTVWHRVSVENCREKAIAAVQRLALGEEMIYFGEDGVPL